LLPAATVTDAGVVSRALLSESVTVVALVGAALRVTVHELEAPDPKLEGLHDNPETVGEEGVELVTVPPAADIPTK